MADVDRSSGAAKRRRQRRLRSWWRHERMSVAAALVEATHHSFPKGGWSEAYKAPRGPKTVSAQVEPELFELSDEEPGGARPDRPRWASGPQERGPATHRGAHRRQCAGRAVSRCSCAADGGCPLSLWRSTRRRWTGSRTSSSWAPLLSALLTGRRGGAG